MKWITGCVFTALWALSSCAWSGHQVHAKQYWVGADIDASGSVTRAQVAPNVPKGIARTLKAALHIWHFKPVRVDGRAVTVHTYVNILLQAIPDANGKYMLRLRYLGNGPRASAGTLPLPKYPQDRRRHYQSALLILHATVMPDGHLSHLHITNCIKGRKIHPSFAKATRKAAADWRIKPLVVDGKPIATRVKIPVYFVLGSGHNYFLTNSQRIYLRRKDKEYQTFLKQEDAHRIPLTQGQLAAIDSPVQPDGVQSFTVSAAP